MSITEQIVLDKQGKPVAVQIPIEQYRKILERMEDLDDIDAYKKAKALKSERVSFEEAFAEIEKQHSER